MRRALEALTVLRLGAPPAPRPLDALAYPVVGALLGVVWVLVGRGVSLYLGPAVAAGAILLVDAWLTRAQHLDGLASVVDGAALGEHADDALQVMREPALGALGATAMIALALVRFGLLIQLAFPPGQVLFGVVATASLALLGPVAAGRLAMVVCQWQAPWRDDEADAAPPRPPAPAVALATLLTLAFALPAGWRGVIGVVAALAVTAAFLAWWLRRFGALVAEAPAAACLLAETAALLAVVTAV